MDHQTRMPHSTDGTNLADLLERILDKGVVIAGDIRINLVQVELLTIQIRLVVCSVDKAKEMGLDWWARDRRLTSAAAVEDSAIDAIGRRLERIERTLAPVGADATATQ